MVNRISSCDPDRLRSYLDDELSPGEEADLVDHLDRYGTCQRALKRLVAGSGLRRDLRRLGRSSDGSTTGFWLEDQPVRPEGKLVAVKQPVVKKTEPVDDWGPVKPRRRVGKLVAGSLLLLIGLGVVAVYWLLGSLFDAVEQKAVLFTPPPAAPPQFGPVAPAGFAGPPAAARQTVSSRSDSTVIIGNQAGGDQPTIVGSGKPATKTWDLTDFTAVEIRNTFRASLTRAERFAVSVTADDNVLDHVKVAKDGTRLRVGLEEGLSYQFRGDSLRLMVALPVLEEIELTGTARATIQGFDSDRPFHARAAGATRLDGSIRAGDVRFDLEGTSTVKLDGSARDARLLTEGASKIELAEWTWKGEKLSIEVRGSSSVQAGGSVRAAMLKAEGASHLNLSDLALETADVELDGVSRATIRVKDRLDYEINGASRLEYRGEPTIGKARKSGVSSVSHR